MGAWSQSRRLLTTRSRGSMISSHRPTPIETRRSWRSHLPSTPGRPPTSRLRRLDVGRWAKGSPRFSMNSTFGRGEMLFRRSRKGPAAFSGASAELGNELLLWAQEQDDQGPIEQAMRYMATRIASTARNLPPMPSLDVARLTFRRVTRVVDELLGVPSGGAHEQFVFASLLHALAEEYGGRRVETKTLSASDASAGTAADVQVLDGGTLTEAYEVTANPWISKVGQATAVLRHHDLARVHIVAPGPAPSGPRSSQP